MKKAQLIRITADASSLPSMCETITSMEAYGTWTGSKLFAETLAGRFYGSWYYFTHFEQS